MKFWNAVLFLHSRSYGKLVQGTKTSNERVYVRQFIVKSVLNIDSAGSIFYADFCHVLSRFVRVFLSLINLITL